MLYYDYPLELAAFYAFHSNSDLTRLEYFARTQLGESLSPQVACDTLAALTPAQQTAFCAQWAQRHVGGDLLLYRVPARTAESGPELAWDGVEPLNLSLLVSAQRTLPLCYALDADVPHVVAQARALGLTGRITMVGAAEQAAAWYQQGYEVLVVLPPQDVSWVHLREKSHLIPFTCAYGPYNLGKIFGTLLRYQNDGVGIALFTTAAKPNPWACRERYHDSWCYAQMVAQLKTEVWGERLVVHSERVEQGKLFVLFLAMIGQSNLMY